jgi:predicted transcriptional regulator
MSDKTDKLLLMIRRSRIKREVLRMLSRSMRTSSKIASRIDFRSNHVTIALKDLRKKKCVRLMNPYDKEPDIYRITDLGKKLLFESREPAAEKKNKSYRRSGKRRNIS